MDWSRAWRILCLACFLLTCQATDGHLRAQESSSALPPGVADSDSTDELDELLEMADRDVSQLTRVEVSAPALQEEVTTVSRQPSTVGRSPAAVFVITQEMIRRSGALTLPEVLRMAPGVQVARIDANQWAISIRGFNERFSNKLLVQIDGRTVYSPLFGGVFWDVQDVLLEDIDRIEVIRGPGGTLWGANAVNGVINVLTKHAGESQGEYLQGGTGSEERGFVNARYGGQLGENAQYRFYGKWFEREAAFLPGGVAEDDWRMGRGGFRVDWAASEIDNVTFQGDLYRGNAGGTNRYPDLVNTVLQVGADQELAGGNALLRWNRWVSEDSDWTLQLYEDHTERLLDPIGFREDRDTFDLDFQNRIVLNWQHTLIWGFGYRNTRDRIRSSGTLLSYTPAKRADDLFSYFAQDEMQLVEDEWFLTVGAKFQHNDYTGFELQPTARLLWTPTPRHSLWTAVSRAVRTPTRSDHNVVVTTLPTPGMPAGMFPQYLGNPAFESESLIAYELGVREQTTEFFSWDVALFYHDYDHLRGAVPLAPAPPFLPVMLTNLGGAATRGGEVSTTYQVTPDWKLLANYSLFVFDVDPGLDSPNAPRNQVYLQSGWDFGEFWEFDAIWRYVDNIEGAAIPSYNVMDLRLAYFPYPNWEVALVARHLLDAHHPEMGTDAPTGLVPTEVQREYYGTLTWRY